MAGAGYRTWVAGEVIEAENINDFLQDQVVQVYANATARSAALTGVIAEGMVSYLKDINSLEAFDGTNWNPVGADPEIFTQGTAGQYLKSLGTAGVEWQDGLNVTIYVQAGTPTEATTNDLWFY
jgi:hypothetical protein